MSNNILVAPLNWGLGHATRCIPIIIALLENGFTPIIASDGIALALLQKEFPNLQSINLPSYNIKYPKNGKLFKVKMLLNSPKMFRAIINEKKAVAKILETHNIKGIISDNRLGVRSKKIPSVFVTHQLNVKSGNTTKLSSKIHQFIIKKYSQCWVPDVAGLPNLSGELGHLKKTNPKIKYIGPLSRFNITTDALQYDLMVLLSGPEPQRTFLEELIIKELKFFVGKVIFVKGKIEEKQTKETIKNISFYNFMTSDQLESTINKSELILCRSGYTTIMDLAKLEKKAFFIPTPGQFEQEYLAKKFKDEGLIPYCKQEKFTLRKLLETDFYKGFTSFAEPTNWSENFKIFRE